MRIPPEGLLKYPAIPLAVGIASGFATAAVARFSDPIQPLVGAVFGFALIILLRPKYKSCSAWVATALLTSSVVAYCAAVWGTLIVSGFLDRLLGQETKFTELFGPGMFSVAGFIGALILNLALQLLFSSRRGSAIPRNALLWALLGAFFGVISTVLVGSVGAGVRTLVALPKREWNTNQYYVNFFAAYLIWQTGMAVVLPLMLPENSFSVTGPVKPNTLSTGGKIYFACILLAFAILVCFFLHDLLLKWTTHTNAMNAGIHSLTWT